MDLSSLNLSIKIIELSEKFSSLSKPLKDEYLMFLNEEFRAFDDEFSIIVDHILYLLESNQDKTHLENYLHNLMNHGISQDHFEMILDSFILYFDEYYT